MATVINVTVQGQETLVNLEAVASIAFSQSDGSAMPSAMIVMTAPGIENQQGSRPHAFAVNGEDDVANLRAELVRVGWLAADPMPQNMASFEAPKPYNPGWNR